ncbi:hypothetical protein EMCRGX_G029762 [Ephydatia muelleri]
MDSNKIAQINELMEDHLKLQMDQRKRYHCIRERAETDRSIMPVIIDGMDQNSTQLPHTKRLQKSDANL